ncbi:MAG: hypothetical protein EA401_01310 [Planctomycetota bacterium]|nr:MAG: hypothetical protein EA401_01310 [Planctomycetota bacterium]
MAKITPASLQKTLMKVSASLQERYGSFRVSESDDFIACLILQILELGATERAAREALKRIREEYVDWNDMRVASIREIQDILGPRYVRCREKAEDLHSLLADIYTAFRRMEVNDMVVTPDGIATLRALPDTTLIRADMVETALLTVCGLHTFPCDEEQFRLLKFLGGVPKQYSYEMALEKVKEALDNDQLLALSHGLREHTDFLQQQEIDEPKPVDFGWEKAKKPARKSSSASKKTSADKKKTTSTKKSSSPKKKTTTADTKK